MATLRTLEKLRLLTKVPLFEGLGSTALESLASDARVTSLKAREEIFHRGDSGSQLYVVISGRLKALTTSSYGDDVVFHIIGPGEVFGEIAVLGVPKRTATVRALERCELLAVDRRDLLAVMRRNPEVAIRLLSVLAERARNLSELFEDVHFLNLPHRLAKKLVTISGRYGERVDGSVRIDLKLSQEEWGDLVGATRESINKQIKTWAEEGIVRMERGYVVIEDWEEIERLARLSVL